MSIDRKEYQPITGNPRRNTKKKQRSKEANSSSKSKQPHKRKSRVQVTPRDWNKVEAIAEELGLPYSKVYNMAFQALLEKLGKR